MLALLPSIIFMASMTIDFPAPVSPVRTVIPLSKLSEISSIIAKFLMAISKSIPTPYDLIGHPRFDFLTNSITIFSIFNNQKQTVIICQQAKNKSFKSL